MKKLFLLVLSLILLTLSSYANQLFAERIIYDEEGMIAFFSTRDNEQGIYVMSSDGSNQKKLVKLDKNDWVMPAIGLSLSPDRKRIAFMSYRKKDILELSKCDIAFHWIIYVLDSNGTNLRKLTDTPVFSMFWWSPGGNKIAFISSYEDPNNYGKDGVVSTAIYIIDSDGRNQKRLTSIAYCDGFLNWSPDEKHIIFSSNRDENFEIYIMDSDGSEQRRLTNNPAVDNFPIWFPDGKKIVFMSNRDVDDKIPSQTNIYVVDIDGKNLKRLTDSPSYKKPICVSPDGEKIIFSSGGHIYVMDINGKNQRSLVGKALEVALSPNGKKLVFRTNRDGNWEIYTVDLNGKNLKNLTNNKADDMFPTWQ